MKIGLDVVQRISDLSADIRSCESNVQAARRIFSAYAKAISDQEKVFTGKTELLRSTPDHGDKPAYRAFQRKLAIRNAEAKKAQAKTTRQYQNFIKARACIDTTVQKVQLLARCLPLEPPWPDYARIIAELAVEIIPTDQWIDPVPARSSLALLKLRLAEMSDRCRETGCVESFPPSYVRKHWMDEKWSERLRNARTSLGHSLKEAANKCCTTEETYRKWEGGRRPLERSIGPIVSYIQLVQESPT